MPRIVVRRRSDFPRPLVEQVHRLRHHVFKERLGWDVESVGGWELDRYDALDPLLGVCLDERGGVSGCWRLLPTTGDCLTKDRFRPLLHGAAFPADPDIWEATRFAVRGRRNQDSSLGGLRLETRLLVGGLLNIGLQMGLARIIAVSDLRFERILARSGLVTQRFGPPLPCGAASAVAGWFDVTHDNLMRVEGAAGLAAPQPAAA